MIDRQVFRFVPQLQLEPLGQQGLEHGAHLLLCGGIFTRRLGGDAENQRIGPGGFAGNLIFLHSIRGGDEGSHSPLHRHPVAHNPDALAGSAYE